MSEFKMYVRPDVDQPGLWLWVVYRGNQRHEGSDVSFPTRFQAVLDALNYLDKDMVLEVETEENESTRVVDETDDRDQDSPQEFTERMDWSKYDFDSDPEWF